MKEKKFYQLKITLKESNPSIWRRILISSDTLLPDLHKIIQTVMGWTNSHLHQFIDEKTFYAEPDEYNELAYVDYRAIAINKLLKKEKARIVYEYDFGDGWEHEIILEKVLEGENDQVYPQCLEGKNTCPPEDCGGIWGYMNLLKIIADPKHEEYDEMMEYLGGEFDPETFDKKEVNELLKTEDYGVFSW